MCINTVSLMSSLRGPCCKIADRSKTKPLTGTCLKLIISLMLRGSPECFRIHFPPLVSKVFFRNSLWKANLLSFVLITIRRKISSLPWQRRSSSFCLIRFFPDSESFTCGPFIIFSLDITKIKKLSLNSTLFGIDVNFFSFSFEFASSNHPLNPFDGNEKFLARFQRDLPKSFLRREMKFLFGTRDEYFLLPPTWVVKAMADRNEEIKNWVQKISDFKNQMRIK